MLTIQFKEYMFKCLALLKSFNTKIKDLRYRNGKSIVVFGITESDTKLFHYSKCCAYYLHSGRGSLSGSWQMPGRRVKVNNIAEKTMPNHKSPNACHTSSSRGKSSSTSK